MIVEERQETDLCDESIVLYVQLIDPATTVNGMKSEWIPEIHKTIDYIYAWRTEGFDRPSAPRFQKQPSQATATRRIMELNLPSRVQHSKMDDSGNENELLGRHYSWALAPRRYSNKGLWLTLGWTN